MSEPLAGHYAASFASASFLELTEDGWYLEPDEVTKVDIQHIAGTDDNDVSVDGQEAVTFELPIGCNASALSTLRGARGDSGTLSYHAGSLSCVLKDIVNIRKADGFDGYKATLRFIV